MSYLEIIQQTYINLLGSVWPKIPCSFCDYIISFSSTCSLTISQKCLLCGCLDFFLMQNWHQCWLFEHKLLLSDDWATGYVCIWEIQSEMHLDLLGFRCIVVIFIFRQHGSMNALSGLLCLVFWVSQEKQYSIWVMWFVFVSLGFFVPVH